MSVRGIGINNFDAMIVRIIFILLALWIEGVGFLEIIWSILEIIWSSSSSNSSSSRSRNRSINNKVVRRHLVPQGLPSASARARAMHPLWQPRWEPVSGQPPPPAGQPQGPATMALVYETVEAWVPSAVHPHYLPLGQGEIVLWLFTWNGWADVQPLDNRNMERRWVPTRLLRSLDYTVRDADGLLRSPRLHQWLDLFRSCSGRNGSGHGDQGGAPACSAARRLEYGPPPTSPPPAWSDEEETFLEEQRELFG